MEAIETGLRIDLGCGSLKKEGTLGVDILEAPGVDHILDMETQPLPFADGSVAYVHSSHFLEHTQNTSRIFAEISRVCMDGARLELWTPYAWSNPAFILGHKVFFTEDIYLHICHWFVDFWRDILGARWVLDEFQYIVQADTLCYLKAKGISLDFALRHMHNVVTEFGTHITVLKTDGDVPPPPPHRRTFSTARLAPRYEVQVDRIAHHNGAEMIGEIPNEALEEAIRTFARGEALPSFEP